MPHHPAPNGDRPAPPARDGGDACPGALRLHTAADGSLARIRLRGGALDATQAETLATVAELLGDARLDLTSRGNLQLRGLGASAGRELAVWLESADLLPSRLHERVRNFVASPLAGLDGHGHAPVYGALAELDRLLCESERATALSGRFLFAVDDGRGDVAALAPDVTLVARPGGATHLLRLGRSAVAEVDRAAAPAAALAAAEHFLDGADAAPAARVWRVRELPAAYAPTDATLHAHLADRGVPARPATGPVPPPGAPPVPGPVQGPDGVRSLTVLAPLGRLTAAQLRTLADLARRYGRGELRLTPWRSVVLPGAGEADACAEAAAAGLVTDPASPWHGVGACTGRPGCDKALADVRADATRAVEAAPASRPLPVYWSGCERRCGHPTGDHPAAWVDVLADGAGGYRVTRRTRDADAPAPAAPAAGRQATTTDELAAALAAATHPE